MLLARGCSTIESGEEPGDCENHMMETGEERFCYCKDWLCNSSVARRGSLWWLSAPSLLPFLLEVMARLTALLGSLLDKFATLTSVTLRTNILNL